MTTEQRAAAVASRIDAILGRVQRTDVALLTGALTNAIAALGNRNFVAASEYLNDAASGVGMLAGDLDELADDVDELDFAPTPGPYTVERTADVIDVCNAGAVVATFYQNPELAEAFVERMNRAAEDELLAPQNP